MYHHAHITKETAAVITTDWISTQLQATAVVPESKIVHTCFRANYSRQERTFEIVNVDFYAKLSNFIFRCNRKQE
jgi:predicted Zn-dependent protease